MTLLATIFCLALGAYSLPHYSIENWIDLKPSSSATGQMLDSVEYQLLLPAAKFYSNEGRKRDIEKFKNFLRDHVGNVKSKTHEYIRTVTLYDISLMDPSQEQTEAETEWELKQRTVLQGQGVTIGETDLTIKRGAVPDHFDWYPDHATLLSASATDVENKFELDIQCAERDFTQATKFTFPPGVVPKIRNFLDLQSYFPKLFDIAEVKEALKSRLSAPLLIGEINFEWAVDIVATILGVDITFVIGTRHLDFDSARNGDKGWAIRAPELNFRIKRKHIPNTATKQKEFLNVLETLFNALLASEWNAHEDCGQWNGVKSCPPNFHLKEGTCVSQCKGEVAPINKVPRGAGAMSTLFGDSESLPHTTSALLQQNKFSSSAVLPPLPIILTASSPASISTSGRKHLAPTPALRQKSSSTFPRSGPNRLEG